MRMLEYWRAPMFSNAYMLIFNQFTSAGLGMLYWMFATHFFSADVVGQSSATISTIIFLAALSELSLKSGMTRFVPRSGKQTPRLVIYTYAIILVSAALISSLFFFLGQEVGFTVALFEGTDLKANLAVLGTIAWTIYMVEDGVLNGMRRSIWVLINNTIFNVAKILFLILSIWVFHSYGIVGSWFIPVPFVILFVNLMIFKRFMPVHITNANPQAAPVSTRQIVTSVTGDNIGTLLAETCVRLLPLMVLNLISKSANAYFSQTWLVAMMLYMIATNMATSFTVEAASNLRRVAIYSRQMLRHMALLIVPLSVLIFIAAPFVLGLFGAEYARQGTALLRLLVLATLPIILNNWYLSYMRLMGDVKAIILNQGLLCILTLGLSYWWLPQYGIIGIGLAWLVTQTLIALVVVGRTAPMLLSAHIDEEEGGDLPLNQALRRVDWRYLTSKPQPQRSLCLAPGGLARSAAEISCEMVTDLSAAGQGIGGQGYDLAIAVNPEASVLRGAYKALHADGACYTEWAAWRKGGARGIRRRLQAVGYTDIKLYWPFPSPAMPRFWMPLPAEMAPCLYVMQKLFSVDRMVNRIARIAAAKTLQFIVSLGFLPYLSAVAYKSSPHSPDVMDLIEAESSHSRLNPSGGRLSYLVQTAGTRITSKIVILAFHAASPQPSWVAKLVRVPEYAHVLLNELDLLKRLNASKMGELNGLALPNIVFGAEFNHTFITGQTALAGAAIDNFLQGDRIRQTALQLTQWLIQLAKRTQSHPRSISSQQLIEQIIAQLDDLAGGALPPAEIAQTRQVLRLAHSAPLMCVHNDFASWNILRTTKGLGVFDWTGGDWNGFPLTDLVWAIYSLALGYKDLLSTSRMVTRYQDLLMPSSRLGGIFHECLALYIEAVGLDTSLITPLRLLTWIQHRISEHRLHSLSVRGGMQPERLDESWCIALWRAELAEQHHPTTENFVAARG